MTMYNNQAEDFRNWNKNLGHISAERFLKLRHMSQDVQIFTTSLVKTFDCETCFTRIMKNAKVHQLPTHKTLHKIHLYVSVLMKPSVVENPYVSHPPTFL